MWAKPCFGSGRQGPPMHCPTLLAGTASILSPAMPDSAVASNVLVQPAVLAEGFETVGGIHARKFGLHEVDLQLPSWH